MFLGALTVRKAQKYTPTQKFMYKCLAQRLVAVTVLSNGEHLKLAVYTRKHKPSRHFEKSEATCSPPANYAFFLLCSPV